MTTGPSALRHPRILTNMAFRESALWTSRVDSLYPPAAGRDPEPLSPWREAVALARRCHGYDVVVTMGSRPSLAYGLVRLLRGAPSRQILTEFFIDAPRPQSLAWRVKTALYRQVLRRSIGVLTNSSAECAFIAERFTLSPDRIRYVPMHTTMEAPACVAGHDGFILAAGRTLRDYGTYARAAARLPDVAFHVVCGRDDLPGSGLPANLVIHREIARDAYLDLLRRATVVALPLHPAERATGQVVLLEAMALGKPVITHPAPGVIDHVVDGETGLYCDFGDDERLAALIEQLRADAPRRERIGRAAVAYIRRETAPDTHAQRKLAAIAELWEASRG